MDILETTLAGDTSDLAENCRTACMAGLPDAEVKARVWAEITDPNNSDSAYVRSAKMSAFYSGDQMELCEPYFDKFYDVLVEFHNNFTHKVFSAFFAYMMPKMKVTDAHIVRLLTILQDTPDNEQMFRDTMQDGLDSLVRMQQCRALAKL